MRQRFSGFQVTIVCFIFIPKLITYNYVFLDHYIVLEMTVNHIRSSSPAPLLNVELLSLLSKIISQSFLSLWRLLRHLTYIVIYLRTYYYAARQNFTTVFAAVTRPTVSSRVFPAAFIDDADRIKASPIPSLWFLLLSDLENILLTIHTNGDQDVNLDSCVS